eukprot:GEMP01064621.1.p1 GENE.GEMP01064621.1~~GEMP01064621.1.p1  ORF type:complete len:257 (+),score=42.32 GEMP01064621.1:46-816(+)
MSRRTRAPPQAESGPRDPDVGQQAQPQVLGQSTPLVDMQQPAHGQAQQLDQQRQSYPETQAQTTYQHAVQSSYRQLYIDPEDLKPELTVESSSRGRLSQSRVTPAEVFVQTQASVHRQFRKVKVEQAHQFGVNTEDPENQSPKRRRPTAKTYKEQGVLLQVPALRAVTLDWQASTLQLQNHEDAELFDLLVISDRIYFPGSTVLVRTVSRCHCSETQESEGSFEFIRPQFQEKLRHARYSSSLASCSWHLLRLVAA